MKSGGRGRVEPAKGRLREGYGKAKGRLREGYGKAKAGSAETARLASKRGQGGGSQRARTCRARHALCTARAARRVRCACSGAALSATATACCRRRRRAAAARQRLRPRHSATCSAQMLPAASLALRHYLFI